MFVLMSLIQMCGLAQRQFELSICRSMPPVLCYPSHEVTLLTSVIDGVYANSFSITLEMRS